MDITLKPQLRRYLAQKVNNGQFRSPSDVVNFALDRLKQDERDLEWLRQELQKGIGSLDRGAGEPWDLEEQKSRLLRRVTGRRRKNSSRDH